ncbi:MAG: glyoxylate/hydroxypyruvate reductase A [Balneolaceae bacterium]|nr:glyoxylate/hydroxypyruvate reductase A [Balneolaceae bacterium]
MSLLLVAPNRNLKALKEAILEEDPNIEIDIWPAISNKEKVNFAVCWKHPDHLLGQLPNLQAVSSLGAGVNHLLNDDGISENTKLCRIVTPTLKEQIADYVLNAISNYRHHTLQYITDKKNSRWEQQYTLLKKNCTPGIMGLGEMGLSVASLLVKNGYQVNGWSNSKKEIEHITSYAGEEEFEAFLNDTNILICLLPLTQETKDILDLSVFQKLKQPAYLINVGRGEHLVEEDLIYALDTETLDGACLDVFNEEPLPAKHTFWNRSNIMITPHIAAVTPPEEAAPIIVENYKRTLSGMELKNEVDRKRGY